MISCWLRHQGQVGFLVIDAVMRRFYGAIANSIRLVIVMFVGGSMVANMVIYSQKMLALRLRRLNLGSEDNRVAKADCRLGDRNIRGIIDFNSITLLGWSKLGNGLIPLHFYACLTGVLLRGKPIVQLRAFDMNLILHLICVFHSRLRMWTGGQIVTEVRNGLLAIMGRLKFFRVGMVRDVRIWRESGLILVDFFFTFLLASLARD